MATAKRTPIRDIPKLLLSPAPISRLPRGVKPLPSSAPDKPAGAKTQKAVAPAAGDGYSRSHHESVPVRRRHPRPATDRTQDRLSPGARPEAQALRARLL